MIKDAKRGPGPLRRVARWVAENPVNVVFASAMAVMIGGVFLSIALSGPTGGDYMRRMHKAEAALDACRAKLVDQSRCVGIEQEYVRAKAEFGEWAHRRKLEDADRALRELGR